MSMKLIILLAEAFRYKAWMGRIFLQMGVGQEEYGGGRNSSCTVFTVISYVRLITWNPEAFPPASKAISLLSFSFSFFFFTVQASCLDCLEMWVGLLLEWINTIGKEGKYLQTIWRENNNMIMLYFSKFKN